MEYIPFILFLLFMVACGVAGGYLGKHHLRPLLQRRADRERKAELEVAVMQYERDEYLLDEILRERRHR